MRYKTAFFCLLVPCFIVVTIIHGTFSWLYLGVFILIYALVFLYMTLRQRRLDKPKK